MKEELLSTKNAAEYLGVSTSTIYRMTDKGILKPSKTPGGHRRYSTLDLNSYKEDSRNTKSKQNPSKSKYDDTDVDETTNEVKLFNTDRFELNNKIKSKIKNDDKKTGISKENPDENLVEKPVDPRNKLNDLNGTKWLPATKSYFYQKGLGRNHKEAQIEKQHPAPYSYQDIHYLMEFFTKEGMEVLDPFGGVGSTAKAAALSNRKCTSIELSNKFHNLSIERLETEVGEGESEKHNLINGDSSMLLKDFEDNSFDYVVTSPPYWSILNKKPDHKTKKRVEKKLQTNYSTDDRDLGNVEDYDEFLEILVEDIFMECARLLKPKKYMNIVISDFRNKSDFVSFHSDLIQIMNKREIDEKHTLYLQGVKVLLQNHKSLLPYGYPYAYVENIHHQYVLIFRKDVTRKDDI